MPPARKPTLPRCGFFTLTTAVDAYRYLESGEAAGKVGATAELVRHRQTKGAETDMFDLELPRHTSTLHEGEAEGGAKPARLCPRSSDVRRQPVQLRRERHRLQYRIPDAALDLRIPQQQLHGT